MPWASVGWVVALSGCAGLDDGGPGQDRPLGPATAPVALTDTNADPDIVEVHLVASTSTVEYLAERPTPVWAYRDGALPGSVGTVPGPLLRAKLGDRIIIHFYNELPPATLTSLHLHGPRLPVDTDGAHGHRHGLHPGDAERYEFVARDAGTFWYHPHVDSYQQVERGLYGPMVVTDGAAVDVAADRVLILDDVKLAVEGTGALSGEITAQDQLFGRQGNVVLVNGSQAPVALQVQAGARERWRLINAANGRFFNVRIPGLRFLVIGSDGGLLSEPHWVEALQIVPGERYDVLVTFDGDPGATKTLEAVPYPRGDGDEQGLVSSGAQGLVQVLYGPRAEAPAPLPAFWRDLPPMQVGADTVVRSFTLGENRLPGGAMLFTINGDVWPDVAPVEVEQGDVEIWEIVNGTGRDHPVHLHGMFFEVLSGPAAAARGWKDTVNVPRLSTLRFAVQLDPPGLWMFQSTVLERADAGMMLGVSVRARATNDLLDPGLSR